MYQAVQAVPPTLQACHRGLDLVVVGHIAGQHDRAAESGGEFADTVLETIAHICKCQFGALPMTCAGNAVSNGPVRQNAGDQNAFTFKKTHVVYPLAINKSAVNQPRTCVPGTRSRLPIESLLLFMRSEEHTSELQ